MKVKETEEEEEFVVDHILDISKNKTHEVPYSEDVLRKLFLYARTLKPVLSDEAADKLKQFYLTLFKASKGQEGMIISRRQIEDLVRLSEASAKLNLRETVTEGDADNAIRLLAESLKQYGLNPLTNKIDQTSAFYGQPTSVSARISQLPDIVKRVASRQDDKTRVTKTAVVDYAKTLWKEDSSYVEKLITICMRDGMLYCPMPGFVSVT